MSLVIKLGRAMRTFAFKTFWWKIGLLRNIEVGQTIANRGNVKAFPQFLQVTIQFAIRACSERSLVDGTDGWNTRNGVLNLSRHMEPENRLIAVWGS